MRGSPRRVFWVLLARGTARFDPVLAALAACSGEAALSDAGETNDAAHDAMLDRVRASDADVHAELDAHVDAAAAASDAGAASMDAQPAPDARAADAGSDAGGSVRDGAGPIDARDGASDPVDAAAYACALDAQTLPGCDSYLCTSDAGPVLALARDAGWTIGGLDWVVSLCARPLGWSSARSTDSRHLLYALTPADLRDLDAGAPVLVYWGGPTNPPEESLGAQRCAYRAGPSTPACPAAPYPPLHASFRGCRGPLDPGCAVCRTINAAASGYRSSSSGADWYNVESVDSPATCTQDCPICAACGYRDEQQSRALAARPECAPCPAIAGTDPCFERTSCGCWCTQSEALRQACPTLVP